MRPPANCDIQPAVSIVGLVGDTEPGVVIALADKVSDSSAVKLSFGLKLELVVKVGGDHSLSGGSGNGSQ